MRIRASVFDIYNTVLEVGPAPPDAEARWLRLCQNLRGQELGTQAGCLRHALGEGEAGPSLAEFDAGCREAIGSRRAIAQAGGIQFPEVFWPDITRAVFPALASLSEDVLDTFLYEHARLARTARLMAGAGEALGELSRRGVILGLCSNCQPYTLRELGRALALAGLSASLFDPQLCFYSFRAGFAKPDPAAFGRLEHELAGRQIPLAEALFVGDSLDHDIHPAQSRSWRSWHLAAAPEGRLGGDWFRLLEFVRQQT